ncbi:hypothetical protein [Curtobacterium citreum]|uniref:Uncharacterized protein n=1 Tax=Curtobacterium citreum TaxID=2036 RepID=A0ABT2HDJ2_9MICO|nr:hypothetical protein [Curtobacterium citreum]MCS6521325.1 hypothetical protein [Curtobacterium citreum]
MKTLLLHEGPADGTRIDYPGDTVPLGWTVVHAVSGPGAVVTQYELRDEHGDTTNYWPPRSA